MAKRKRRTKGTAQSLPIFGPDSLYAKLASVLSTEEFLPSPVVVERFAQKYPDEWAEIEEKSVKWGRAKRKGRRTGNFSKLSYVAMLLRRMRDHGRVEQEWTLDFDQDAHPYQKRMAVWRLVEKPPEEEKIHATTIRITVEARDVFAQMAKGRGQSVSYTIKKELEALADKIRNGRTT